MRNYYDILQVSPDAEQEVIEAAYRRLARKYHPDVYSGPDVGTRMRELNEAYEVLGDPSRRAEYDAELKRAQARARARRQQQKRPPPPHPPRQSEPSARPQSSSPEEPGTKGYRARITWVRVAAVLVLALSVAAGGTGAILITRLNQAEDHASSVGAPTPLGQTIVTREPGLALVRIGALVVQAEVPVPEGDAFYRGLGGRESLSDDRGMLFVFPEPGPQAFWMKDMLIPIDIIWISAEGRVVDIQTAQPEPGVPDPQLKLYNPSGEAKYVLEVRSGLAAEKGVQVGDGAQVELP